MDTIEVICSRRSIRRFQAKEIAPELLEQLLEIARLYPSAGNIQPLRFAVITDEEKRAEIFKLLKWAAYLPEFSISSEESPKAYILLLADSTVKRNCMFDAGGAAAYIMIGARSFGLDSCCLGIADPTALANCIGIGNAVPLAAIALGYGSQHSQVVPLIDSVRYRELLSGDIEVPKYSKNDVLLYSDISHKQP